MRVWIAAGLALIMVPATAVGAFGFGLPLATAGIVGVLLAALVAWPLSRPLFLAAGFTFATRRWVTIVATVATLVASAQLIRLSVFMTDPSRTESAVSPWDPFRTEHSCMSSYAEGARFAAAGSVNIYDGTLYQPRHIGTLKVDRYHYPPPFLLLPRALQITAPDFVHLRALWFAFQLLIIIAGFVAAAVWISGVAGATVLAGGALVLAMPGVVYSLQGGNFQISATPLAAAGFALLVAGRLAAGGTVLAWTAAAKIFPGILVVHLVGARRWSALAWVAGAGVLLLGLTVFIFGTRPLEDFVWHALPEMSDGRAFPHAERPESAAANWSVYGLTVRLRHLGATSLTQPIGLSISSLYGALVIGLAAFVGWRRPLRTSTPSGRLALLQLAVALAGLAACRSPFVGGVYGSVSTLCLMALLAAGTSSFRDARLWMAALVVYGLSVWSVPSPAHAVTPRWLVLSGLLVFATIGLNLWVALRATSLSGSRPDEAGADATYMVPGPGAPAASAATL